MAISPISRSTSLPNLDGKHGFAVATGFMHSIPVIYNESPTLAYEFVRELGRGEYARTYLVRRRCSGRQFACKEVLKGETHVSVARAAREAEVHSALSGHPNVVSLVEIWEDASSFYMFMDLCNGGELFHAISERGSLTELEAATVMKVVLQVLQHCHTRGVAHRDIKPENFMLKDAHSRLEKCNIVAIDFGCSCFASSGQNMSEVVGSPMYLAPEAVAGVGYSKEADIWSAGVLLFSMLSGLSLFEGDCDEQICWSVLHAKIDLTSDPWPFVSTEGKELLAGLLQRNPAQRLSVEQALASPWLHGLTAPSSQPLNLLVIDRILQFATFTPLQRLLLNLTTSCQPHSNHRKQLQGLFDDLDVDGDGLLTQDEFFTGLQDMGKAIPKHKVKALVLALNLRGLGGIKLPQFLAAASDRRCSNVCTLLDKDAFLRCEQEGRLRLTDLAASLEEHNLTIRATTLQDMCQSAGIQVTDASVSLMDLETYLSACKHGSSQAGSAVDQDFAPRAEPASDMTSQPLLHPVAAHNHMSAPAHGHSDEPLSRTASPPPRCCSPDLSHPFFFQRRWDEEKAGGLKSAGPLFAEGSSPPAHESAWTKMMFEKMRAASSESAAASNSSAQKSAHSLGCSPGGSHASSQEGFRSGGVTYWTAADEDMGTYDLEDNDALFGPALTARSGH